MHGQPQYDVLSRGRTSSGVRTCTLLGVRTWTAYGGCTLEHGPLNSNSHRWLSTETSYIFRPPYYHSPAQTVHKIANN